MSKRLPMWSYSSASDWKACGELHYLKRVARIRPKDEGASLSFGLSVDLALCALLEAKKDGKEQEGLKNFRNLFLNDPKKGWQNAFDNDGIWFRRTDYDANVVQSASDTALLKKWEKELDITLKKALAAEKQKEHKRFQGKALKMFNRACWLSMKNKAELMLDAFLKDVYPKIKKVIAIQHKVEGEIDDIARIGGYIDLICMYEGYDTPVVLDIKTSASFYDSDRVMFSEQLLLYLKAVGEELETDLVGYIVLLKIMKSNKVCDTCGFQKPKTSKHRSCNNKTKEGDRCPGKWSSKPSGQTQVLINKISKERVDDSFEGFKNTAILAGQNLRYKDFNSCFRYGMCDYFHLCHYNDKSRYNFPKEKKGDKK